ESGTLVGRYKVGWSKGGLHQTAITVTTDDASSSKTMLGMRIMVEETAEISPEVLWWKKGSAPSTQEAAIHVVRSTPLNLISAETVSTDWTVKLIPVTPGWEYKVRITPSDLFQAQSAVFLVNPAPAPGNPQPFRIRARVK